MAGPRSAAPTAAEAELLLLQSQALAEEEAAKARRALLTRFLQVRDTPFPTSASPDPLQTTFPPKNAPHHPHQGWGCPCSAAPPGTRDTPSPTPALFPPQEKLSREEQSSKWGLHKVRSLWLLAHRKTKDQELRQDLELLSQTFNRVMNCKDGVIEVPAGLPGRGQSARGHK